MKNEQVNQIGPRVRTRRQLPMGECPNCGEYKFSLLVVERFVSEGWGRMIRWPITSGTWEESESFYQCKNCKYSEE